tara:strand:- start:978 stop:1322 length:345 start_codon:yes stop_codon:yes gene_type:complete
MASIKFEIFRNRKKFNIINWLKNSNDNSYESFVSFLSTKSVESPGEEYFKKALDLLESLQKRENDFKQSKKTSEAVTQETVAEQKVIKTPRKTTKPASKPKSSTRRRRKKTNES